MCDYCNTTPFLSQNRNNVFEHPLKPWYKAKNLHAYIDLNLFLEVFSVFLAASHLAFCPYFSCCKKKKIFNKSINLVNLFVQCYTIHVEINIV